ncbi:MAG: TonB-dependent receptor [Rhizobacter sp.]|nr:TonB-dependent receptor [Ferruginibacter sp.]
MKVVNLFLLLFFVASNLFAQTGKITGKVINANSGQPLEGASLSLVNTTVVRASDQNGIFSFIKLAPGTYSIKCTYTGFQDKIIEEIVVKENENTDISISLDSKLSDAVVVTSKKVKAAGETVASLLIAQKNSANVSDGITAESIKRTPDKSSSDVIKRVSGASIQDDRFAVIRGLNDRYNASFINGAPLPSTESDRKAFAFDIFPSAILDNLVIYKTATPDKTGEFGGGIIEITTKSTSSKRIGIISIGQGYNSLITGKNRYVSEMQGSRDWLGLDDGSRALPDGLPSKLGFSTLPDRFNDELRLAKGFSKYKWGIKNANTRPNFSFQLAKSFNINRKQQEFITTLFSLNYNRSFVFSSGERNSFDGPGSYIGDPSTPGYYPKQRRKVIDSLYNDEVIWAALGNFSIKINNRHNISWKNNLSINTDNRIVRRVGNYDFEDEPNAMRRETFRTFIQDKIYTTQLVGEHQVGPKKTRINWLAAYSKVNREIPNQMISTDGGVAGGGTTANGTNGGMISTNSQENIKNAKIDITQPYTFMKSNQHFVKVGAGYQYRERDFTSRQLGFIKYGGPSTMYERDESVYLLPDDQVFLSQYLGLMANGKAGIAVQDATVPNSEYQASSVTTHAYIMNDQRFFKKLRVIYGVRMESFNQKLTAPQQGLDSIKLDFTKTDFLPSANFIYALTPKANLRLSYSETVNRPEFRELAPFGFYEYITGLFVFGEDTITRARIKNVDFRYEIYPGKAQLLSASVFYKKFINPIEFATVPVNINEATYGNNARATLYGIEAEFRVLLSTLFGIKRENALLNKFTLAGNGAYIKSKVPLPKDPSDSVEQSRPLQGQSPYIINVSLSYGDEKTGLSSTLSLNRIGERLAIAGSKNRPDFYEKERTVIDFQVAKTFFDNKIEVKFNVRDLLAQNIATYLDMDKTQSFTEQDRIFSSNIAPRVFIFGASFKF